MRDPNRIDEILADLAAVWRKQPDMRLGQLLVSLIRPGEPCPDVFNIEDAQLHKQIRRALDGPPVE